MVHHDYVGRIKLGIILRAVIVLDPWTLCIFSFCAWNLELKLNDSWEELLLIMGMAC